MSIISGMQKLFIVDRVVVVVVGVVVVVVIVNLYHPQKANQAQHKRLIHKIQQK